MASSLEQKSAIVYKQWKKRFESPDFVKVTATDAAKIAKMDRHAVGRLYERFERDLWTNSQTYLQSIREDDSAFDTTNVIMNEDVPSFDSPVADDMDIMELRANNAQDQEDVRFEAGTLHCFCGAKLGEYHDDVYFCDHLLCHFMFSCVDFESIRKLVLSLHLDKEPNLIGVKIVDPRILRPHDSKKAMVYGHFLFRMPLTFVWNFLTRFSYLGRVKAKDQATIPLRLKSHHYMKSIDESVECMFGLVEFENDEDCFDLECFSIAILRPAKNQLIGLRRFLHMSSERVFNFARILDYDASLQLSQIACC